LPFASSRTESSPDDGLVVFADLLVQGVVGRRDHRGLGVVLAVVRNGPDIRRRMAMPHPAAVTVPSPSSSFSRSRMAALVSVEHGLLAAGAGVRMRRELAEREVEHALRRTGFASASVGVPPGITVPNTRV
jgi:hypothetical protein